VRDHGPEQPSGRRGESGPLHLYVNEGKRGITLDLASATGRDLFLRLVAVSDIVIENRDPGELARLDLEYPVLEHTNPRVILTSVSGFGGDGPYRDFTASELTLFAIGGHMFRSGQLGRPPIRMGGYPAQCNAAALAAYATLLAERARAESGAGQQVDFSIFENQVISHAQAMVEVSYYGEETGAQAPRGAQGIRGVPTSDGIAMVSAQEQQMARLAELVGAPDKLGRPDPMDPVGSRLELSDHLARWAIDRTKREVYEQAQAMHIPASYVAAPADLVDSPQYRSRGFIHEAEHPDAGTFSTPGLPFNWEGSEAPIALPPRLGQHNAEVFGELLDIEPEQLPILAAAGVV
jgi:crotonobetainyl-CoA:carnitine CoA-transferase CaiB-like acyl-CoA transferase